MTIDLDTGALTTVSSFPFGSYIGLAFAPDGSFFFTDNMTKTLIQMDTTGTELMRSNFTTPTPILGLEFASVPEPSTLSLFATGLAGLGFMGWRRRRAA